MRNQELHGRSRTGRRALHTPGLTAAAILAALAAGCSGISSAVYRRGAIQSACKPRESPRPNSPGRTLSLVVPPFADTRGEKVEEENLWLSALPVACCWAYWYRPDWLLWQDPVYAAYKPAAQDLAEAFAREFQRSALFGTVRVAPRRDDPDLVLEGAVLELALTWRPHFLGTSYPIGRLLGMLGVPMGSWSVDQAIGLRLVQARDQAVLWSKEFRTRDAGVIAAYYGRDPTSRGYPAKLLEPVIDQTLAEVELLLVSKGEGHWISLRTAKPAGLLPARPAMDQ